MMTSAMEVVTVWKSQPLLPVTGLLLLVHRAHFHSLKCIQLVPLKQPAALAIDTDEEAQVFALLALVVSAVHVDVLAVNTGT